MTADPQIQRLQNHQRLLNAASAGYETLAISARTWHIAIYAHSKLACFCSAPMAWFYSGVDSEVLRSHVGGFLGILENTLGILFDRSERCQLRTGSPRSWPSTERLLYDIENC